MANYDLVSNNEFLGLTSEEQEAQVLMKIRLEKLKEEQSPTNKRKSALLNEDIVRGRINHTMDYFRSKNNFESGDIY